MASTKQRIPAIDDLPQVTKQKVLDMLLADQPSRDIAGWMTQHGYKTSHNTVARYKKHVLPHMLATARKVQAIESLSQKRDTVDAVTADVTKAVIAADPIKQRIVEKQARIDRILAKAEDSANYSACAALEAADTRTLALQAQLDGRLQALQAGTTVQVAVYAPQIHLHQQPEPANVIDADVCEITR